MGRPVRPRQRLLQCNTSALMCIKSRASLSVCHRPVRIAKSQDLQCVVLSAFGIVAVFVCAATCPTIPTSWASSCATSPRRCASAYLDRHRPHPLRREIVATALVNGLVNRAGTTFAFRIGEETGATGPDIVRAPRSRACDHRPGGAVARHRGARQLRGRRRRHADRDVPRVAQARGAGESLAAPAPEAPARDRGQHGRVLRRRRSRAS